MRSAAWVVLIGLGACERVDSTASAPPLALHEVAPPEPGISVMPPPPSLETPPPPPLPPERPRPPNRNQRWWAALTRAQRTDIREVCTIQRDDPCAGYLPIRRRTEGPPPRIAVVMARLADVDAEAIHGFCQRNFGVGACITPLVVAYDEAPIALAPATGARFTFTTPAATDWPTARTPWLALDRDGDGAITSGAELFGDATLLASGARATDGFAALAELDANGDGVIDRHDPMYAALLVWTDRDGDRASTPAELRPLSATVAAIPLAHTADARCDARGNCEGGRAALTWQDAAGARHAGAVVDLYLVAR